MKAQIWNTPVNAPWFRAVELLELVFGRDGVRLRLVEEESGRAWTLAFKNVQAVRVTTEECAAELLAAMPAAGGFFQAPDSAWLRELGKGEVSFLSKSRHFIVSCYDEVVEVVAWEAAFKQA